MFSPVPAIFAIVCIVLAQDEEFFRRRERTFNGPSLDGIYLHVGLVSSFRKRIKLKHFSHATNFKPL